MEAQTRWKTRPGISPIEQYWMPAQIFGSPGIRTSPGLPPNPLFHLYSMVTPYEISGDLSECADPSWVGNKTLTLDEALPMMTIEGAYALFRDQEVGSLLPGKYADLIILSGNPAADLNAIRELEVWMTMVGGEVRWCAPGQEVFCP